MNSFEIVLAMLLAVVASGYLLRLLPLPLPLPLLQIALGVLIAVFFRNGVMLEPDIFFILFLPPLLFLDGWRIPKNDLLRDKGIILAMALGLVVFTVLGAGYMIHWMIPSLPLPVAFALAAVVSPTDPVAVSSIAARSLFPKRLTHILQGESILNDASGLVCFRFAVAAATTGTFSFTSATLAFLWLAAGGIAIGVIVTLLITGAQQWLTRRLDEPVGSSILVNMLLPFGAYMAAEHLHTSGILAAVSAGIVMSHVELSGQTLASTRIKRSAVWDTVQFSLNGVMFVLLGEQLPHILRGAGESIGQGTHMSRWWLAGYALAISTGLIMLRFIWVWGTLRLMMFKQSKSHARVTRLQLRLVLATSLAGARGAITLAGVMTLPLTLPSGDVFPARDLTILLASAIILLSLLAASIGLPRLLGGMYFPDEPAALQAEDRARREAAEAAIAAIGQAQLELMSRSPDPEIYPQAAAYVIGLYQYRLGADSDSDFGEGRSHERDHAEKVLRLAALQAERTTIFQLALHGQLSDDFSRKLVREIDLIEARYH
ncbi:Na+/H+ antiporter [Undibacterium terreum]|uniref:Na+:H+ antiporter n=1 Tax=Undibacterium terreum TaxID=1224302 RepID=A0A916V1N3_9BURK|nr:Na+/H+ antiporter [Undibacterium terreum]GGD02089.1 Na+:H+ antiporter [Undibacterium terreum]